MNLKEPRKKKRVRLQPQPSLPVDANHSGDWRIYTAHLSASGTCIVDPVEMEAVYSMGFFGKGSLSRSFPSFGRRRYGIPPVARNRQWIRRQKWLEELQSLNEHNGPESSEDLERIIGNRLNSSTELADIEWNSEAQASTSKASTESEAALNQVDSNSQIEFDNIFNEPSKKKLKLNSPLTVEKEPNVEENDNAGQIPEPGNNQKETIHELEVVNEQYENIRSERNDESVKIDDNHKTTSVMCEDSVKIDDDGESTHSRISKDSVQVDGNQKTTDSVICDGSMKVDDINKNSSSVICDESLKVDEVVLDSTEDEEICEIVENRSDEEKDVFFLNEEEKSDDDFKYQDPCEIEEESNPYQVLVLPDTDSDTENYLNNVKARIEKEGFPINETLHLTFEETFFLMYGLGCLQLIHYDGSIFSISNAWNHFQLQDKNFIQKYVVYHYFRSKGWVVKPGLKFGGDFLLYKQGPPFYHASYIVIIEVVDADTLLRDDVKSMRKVTWKNLIGLERLSETIAKEILFAQILWPSSIPRNGNQMPVDALSEFTVRELLWRRWDPKRKQAFASTDDEDSDST